MKAPAHYLKRLALWVLCGVVIIFWYGLGKLELLSTPQALPLTSLDRSIPFIPWTVWLYGTITWAGLLAWLQVPDRKNMVRLFAVVCICSMVCSLFFVVWPTTFPRHLYPLPDLALSQFDAATLAELTDLRDSDSPTNCAPSLHVALAWGGALTWVGWLKKRWMMALPICWALVVSACTLTTKQHYVVDVPAGLLVGLLAWWGARQLVSTRTGLPVWARPARLQPQTPEVKARVAKLRNKVEGHQWNLDEIDWPQGPLPPLDPSLVRLINELIYVEEIAGLNFELLAKGSQDDDLISLYTIFADEEQRHAEGLRRVLSLHGAPLRQPGLGNTLVLDEFDALDAQNDADVYLVAVANPVFETMLDAGTVPFLRTHPALKSEWFDELVRRLTRDEAAHLMLNWIVIREAAVRDRGWRGLRLLFNPSIYRGMMAIPFMSLDVYALAHRMGYDFQTLLPAFGKLWRLHRKYTELAGYPLWWVFRLFVVCGVVATLIADFLHRWGLIFIRFWTTFTHVTDRLAWVVFGKRLLRKRGLPIPRR